MLPTAKLLIVESFSTSTPKLLSTEVLTLPTVIELSRSLLAGSSSTSEFVLENVPPPERVSARPPKLNSFPE
ncbi:MAG: hypothetical protein CL909_09650 [Deltaproteobacteria bacterium]|nr:hypothetical protein [Deltaproteobacteria bacterium]